jgi:predicted transcriptional regulator YdeE
MTRYAFGLCVLLASACLLDKLIATGSGQESATRGTRESAVRYEKMAPFSVIGIAARTTNAKEAGPDGVIPKQWQRFFQETVADKVPHRIGTDTYAVYTNYASDHNGAYSFIIGVKVEHGTAPPAGMVSVEVPGGSYAVVTSDKGPSAQVVPAAWRRIFQLEEEGKIHRAYKSDFEVYDQRSQNPQDAQVEIFLGTK